MLAFLNNFVAKLIRKLCYKCHDFMYRNNRKFKRLQLKNSLKDFKNFKTNRKNNVSALNK